jgi:hypothetical protein
MSTARDMTLLGRRMVYDYPQYYNIFSRREDSAGIAQVRNTNRHVLNAYAGADGIKTGYTRAAGFNLVASAQRGQERIIATVFGGRSAAWRNQRIMELLDMGFARAPSNARSACPACRNTTMTDPPAGPRGPTAWCRAASPDPAWPWRAPEPALVAAIGEAVQDAVGEALMEPAPRPSAVAPEAVARALTEALEPVPRTIPGPSGRHRRRPRAETRSAGALHGTTARPGPPLPEVVTRASSTGSRLVWRVARRATVPPRRRTAAASDGAGRTRDVRRGAEPGRAALRRLRGAVRGHDRGSGVACLRTAGRAQHGPARPSALTRRRPRSRFPKKTGQKTRVFRPPRALLLGLVLVIVAEDPVGVALGVVELPALEQPEERAQPQGPGTG